MYDLIIIGGGPAGIAAAVYAARKRLKTVLLTEEIGGQSVVSEGIENWIGSPKIHGAELAKLFQAHLGAVKGDVVTPVLGERVVALESLGGETPKLLGGFAAKLASGKEFKAKAVLIASGAGRRKLEIPGAAKFENKGVTYCASCDGPLFSGMDVAVIGGGNAGFETALQLLAYAKSVTLIHRRPELKADPVTVEKARSHANMTIITNAEPTEVKGEQFVTSITYTDKNTGESKDLSVTGIFVEVGVVPNTEFAKDLVELDPIGRIRTNPRNQRAYLQTPQAISDARHGESDEGDVQSESGTATEPQGLRNTADEVDGGVWAAGDCTDELYHQNNIAAGDGVKALEDIYLWVKMH